MKRLIIFCTFLAGLSSVANSQNLSVKGAVKDNEKNNLIGAVAVLLTPADSVMVSFGVTETDGSFLLSGIKAGKYTLQITYIGYGTLQRSLELLAGTKLTDLGTITMLQEGKMLETVTISADYVPIKVTKDTLEFNADAFKTQPNAVVEELLKKLPGVEVDADGSIKVQGEDVKAVTVDGKEFFGRDPKMATRNLPANAVKKVQIFDKKSKTAEFTGIDDGQEEKTINLELREDKRKGVFGNIMGGYGTDQRYEGKALINRFNKNSQLSAIGSLNNLNNAGINVNDFASMTGGGGMRNMGMSSGAPISFGPNNSGLTNSITTGINFNRDWDTKNKMNVSYYLSQSETDLRQTTLVNSFLPGGALLSDKFYNSLSDGINHNINTVLDLRFDSLTELTFRGSLSLRENQNTSSQTDTTLSLQRILLNLNDQQKNNTTTGNNYSFSINLRRKLAKRGRTISSEASAGGSNTDNIYRILSEVYGRDLVLNPNVSVFQDQNQYSDNGNYNFNASYTEPLKSDRFFLILNGGRRNNKTDLIKDFLDLNPDNLILPGVLNEELSRTFDNRFVYNTAGLNFRFINEAVSASLGTDFQNSNLEGKPSIGEDVNRTFNYFLPKASLDLENLRIRMNYSTSVREPSLEQLQPVLDNSDPLNVYQGNPDLVPEYRHNMRISYNFFDQFNFRSLFANVRLGYTKNRITNASIVDPVLFLRTQKPLNTEFERTLAGNINYSSPIQPLRAKVRLGLNSSLTQGISFINGLANRIDRWSNGYSLTLENKSKSVVDLSVTGRWNVNQNLYLENETLNTQFLNQTYEAYFAWFAGKGWTLDSRMEY